MPSAFTFAYNLNVYFPTADQFILFSLGDYEHIFEVCFGFSSRNIVNKNYLLGKNVLMDIVHFISSTTYICISMFISLNTTMLSKHENTV